MAICNKCFKRIDKNDIICPHCGQRKVTKVTATNPNPDSYATRDAVETWKRYEEETKGMSTKEKTEYIITKNRQEAEIAMEMDEEMHSPYKAGINKLRRDTAFLNRKSTKTLFKIIGILLLLLSLRDKLPAMINEINTALGSLETRELSIAEPVKLVQAKENEYAIELYNKDSLYQTINFTVDDEMRVNKQESGYVTNITVTKQSSKYIDVIVAAKEDRKALVDMIIATKQNQDKQAKITGIKRDFQIAGTYFDVYYHNDIPLFIVFETEKHCILYQTGENTEGIAEAPKNNEAPNWFRLTSPEWQNPQ